jgi:hypothetical protein
MDARLRRLRAEGASWMAIAAVLTITVDAAIERGRRINVPLAPVVTDLPVEDPAREPLSAGHPRAWEVLTVGTWLEGTIYPQPYLCGSVA